MTHTIALARIDAALTRIERTAASRRQKDTSLADRHLTLKAQVAEAIAALDDVIGER